MDSIRAAQRPREGSLPYTSGIADEPGLDYMTMDVEGFGGPTKVTVTDYSAHKVSVSKKMESMSELSGFLNDDRPSWTKVRWIHVNGLNWQCIKLLATTYNLHRLAIEDLLSVQRTKIDTYQDRNDSFETLIGQTLTCVY